jgi:hypothetical protein
MALLFKTLGHAIIPHSNFPRSVHLLLLQCVEALLRVLLGAWEGEEGCGVAHRGPSVPSVTRRLPSPLNAKEVIDQKPAEMTHAFCSSVTIGT